MMLSLMVPFVRYLPSELYNSTGLVQNTPRRTSNSWLDNEPFFSNSEQFRLPSMVRYIDGLGYNIGHRGSTLTLPSVLADRWVCLAFQSTTITSNIDLEFVISQIYQMNRDKH